jgi:Fur family transcriptional regulator, ferric uptake regulator
MEARDDRRHHLRDPGQNSSDALYVQDTVANVIARLRDAGQRLTPQRILLVELLVAHGDHVTADDIHADASDRYPNLNVSTVYRTLEMLRDFGVVSETDLGDGRRRFALLSHDLHHHAICLNCGNVIDVSDQMFDGVRRGLLNEYGFVARIDHTAIFGTCCCCQRDRRPEPER